MARIACRAALCALLLAGAASARAGDAVKYRMPDGSIGFAEDVTRVPAGATVLPGPPARRAPAAAPGSAAPGPAAAPPAESVPDPGAALARQREALQRRVDAARVDAAGESDAASKQAARRYARAQERARSAAVRLREEADKIPCSQYGNSSASAPSDCAARAKASEAAERAERELPELLRAIEDRCMADPECAPNDMGPE